MLTAKVAWEVQPALQGHNKQDMLQKREMRFSSRELVYKWAKRIKCCPSDEARAQDLRRGPVRFLSAGGGGSEKLSQGCGIGGRMGTESCVTLWVVADSWFVLEVLSTVVSFAGIKGGLKSLRDGLTGFTNFQTWSVKPMRDSGLADASSSDIEMKEINTSYDDNGVK